MDFELKRLDPVFIEIYEKEYPMRMTFRAVKEIAEMWGIQYYGLFEKLSDGILEVDEMFDVLYVALKTAGVNLTRDIFDDVDHDLNFITEATNKIVELFERSHKVKDAEKDNKDSTGNKKKKKT